MSRVTPSTSLDAALHSQAAGDGRVVVQHNLPRLTFVFTFKPVESITFFSIDVTAGFPFFFAPKSLRQYDRAIAELRKVIAVNSDFPRRTYCWDNFWGRKECMKKRSPS